RGGPNAGAFFEDRDNAGACAVRSTIVTASTMAGLMVGECAKGLRPLRVALDLTLNRLSAELTAAGPTPSLPSPCTAPWVVGEGSMALRNVFRLLPKRPSPTRRLLAVVFRPGCGPGPNATGTTSRIGRETNARRIWSKGTGSAWAAYSSFVANSTTTGSGF